MANLATINNNLLADSGIDPLDLIVGTGTVNYIPKFTAEGTIGNSIISQSSTTITIAGNLIANNGASSSLIFLGDVANTTASFFEPQNDGKTSYFGRENSSGNWVFATPVTPYSTVIGAYNSTAPIILGHTNAEVTIANGGATTFVSSLTTGGDINANTSSAALKANGYQVGKYSYFGYSTGYPGVIIGSSGFQSLFFNVDVSGNPSGSFTGNGSEYIWRNVGSFKTPNAANTGYNTLLSWNSSGQVTIPGATTIGSLTLNGTFYQSTSNTIPVVIYGDSAGINGLFRIEIDEVNDSFGTGARTFLGDGGTDIFIGTGNSSYTPANSYIALNHGGEISMGAGTPATKHFIISTTGAATFSSSVTATGNNAYVFIGAGASTGYQAAALSNSGGAINWGVANSAASFWGSGGGGAYYGTIGTTNATDFVIATNNTGRLIITSSGSVGIGTTSPSIKLSVNTNATGAIANFTDGIAQTLRITTGTGFAAIDNPSAGALTFQIASSERMRLDASGNLGLGVTPSAWGDFKVLEFPNGVYVGTYTSGGQTMYLGANNYFDGSNYIYKLSGYATRYQQVSGAHQWHISTVSGTAGNVASFTQAMTLNASGNLSIGNTNDTYKLDVSGAGNFSGGVIISGNASIASTARAIWGNTYLQFNSGSTGISFNNSNNTTGLFTILNSGAATFSSTLQATNIGIGNAPTGARLFANQTTNGEWIATFKNYGGSASYGVSIDMSGSTSAQSAFQVYTASGNGIRVLNSNGGLLVGTFTDISGKLVVKQPYTSGTTPIYFGNTSFTAWNRASYDSFVLQQDDVTSFRMVEKNGEANTNDQVLTFSIGDGVGRIATSGQPLQFYVNGSPSGLAYQGLSGTQVLAMNTNGNAQFNYAVGISGALTMGGNITIDKSSPTLRLAGSSYGNSGARIQFEGWAPASGYSNWQIDTAFTGGNELCFVPSTTAGGSTFTSPVFRVSPTGVGSFSSNVYAVGSYVVSSSTTAEIRLQGGGYGGSYNTSLRSITGAPGVLQMGNNGPNYILAGNTAAGGLLYFRVNCASESTSAGSLALTLNANATATFASSVTATAFFESSDSRIKTLLENTIDYSLIANVEARFYEKNGVRELGYFAQDFEEILSSAVYKDENGLLNLSYTQVHTAKIAALEARVKELENQLKNK